ncbi:MAG: large conductance mechanosensitive channel protein MscL [Chloroflexi bacterium]|nr:MAG: large conductance mechanosensitive channel protein MscL [Chloroflexota bacterium]
MFGWLAAFRDFVARGNVIDLAVAVVIGTAFTLVVNSLVADVITPIIGVLLGGINFIQNLSVTIGGAEIRYGAFLQSIITFIITAFALFIIVKAYERFKKKEDKKEEVKQQVQPSQEVVLLTQIRDILDRSSGSDGSERPPQPAPRPSGTQTG